MIELNQKRLIPEKQIANWLNNIKNTKKHIYEDSIATYIEEANQVGKKLTKKPWSICFIINWCRIMLSKIFYLIILCEKKSSNHLYLFRLLRSNLLVRP